MKRHDTLNCILFTILLLFLACALTAGTGWAQSTISASWIDSSGNWTNSANWACSPAVTPCVPNNGANSFNAAIDAPGNTVTLDSTSSPPSVSVDALDLKGGTLMIAQSASLSVVNSLTNDGALDVVAGGKIQTAALANLDFHGNLSGGKYAIAGSLLYLGGPIVAIASNTSVSLEGPDAVLGSSTLETFSPTFINNGTFALNNHSLTIDEELINNGQVALGNGSVLTVGHKSSGGFVNNAGVTPSAATIDIEGGSTLNIFGGIGDAGKIVLGAQRSGNTLLATENIGLDSGGSLAVDGVQDQVSAGGVNNNGGALSLATGSSLTVTGGGYGGYYDQTAGTTDVNGTLIAPAVNIGGGVLSGTGTVKSEVTIGAGGTVSPGDAPGPIHIKGNLDLAGTLDEAIDSVSGFAVTDVSGQLTLGPDSVLSVTLGPGYDPSAGTNFTILTFGSLADGSQFASVVNQYFDNGSEEWSVAYDATDIVLTAKSVRPTPEPASLLLISTGLLVVAWLGFQSKAYAASRRVRAVGSGRIV